MTLFRALLRLGFCLHAYTVCALLFFCLEPIITNIIILLYCGCRSLRPPNRMKRVSRVVSAIIIVIIIVLLQARWRLQFWPQCESRIYCNMNSRIGQLFIARVFEKSTAQAIARENWEDKQNFYLRPLIIQPAEPAKPVSPDNHCYTLGWSWIWTHTHSRQRRRRRYRDCAVLCRH